MKLRLISSLLIVSLFAFGSVRFAHARSSDASALLKMESEFQKATAEKGWDGYEEAELIAARALLDRDGNAQR